MAGRLSDEEIAKSLTQLRDWSRTGDEIRKQFAFADFLAAIAFVNKIAPLAESAQHHPDITINYNKVTLALTTHDLGGISDKDIALATQAEAAARA